MTNERQTPEPTLEGLLLDEARRKLIPSVSVREAARRADISEGRWRQIVKGYQQITADTAVPAVAPADTLAAMADAVDLTPADLREVGRADAADVLARMKEITPERKVTIQDYSTQSLLEELQRRLGQDAGPDTPLIQPDLTSRTTEHPAPKRPKEVRE